MEYKRTTVPAPRWSTIELPFPIVLLSRYLITKIRVTENYGETFYTCWFNILPETDNTFDNHPYGNDKFCDELQHIFEEANIRIHYQLNWTDPQAQGNNYCHIIDGSW